MSLRVSRRLLVLALLFTTACDCENQVRKMLSNQGDRKMPAADAGEQGGPAETEPNDKPAAATPIRIGKELREIRGSIDSAGDVDWFELAVDEESASLEVTVSPATALDVSLDVDVKGGAPLEYDAARRGDAEVIPVLRVSTAPQKFAIRSEAGSTGAYTISFKRHLVSEGLEAEPNDDAEVATKLMMPGEVQARFDQPDDRDVFRLEGAAGVPYVLEIVPTRRGQHIARVFEDAGLTKPIMTLQVAGDVPTQVPNVALSAEAVRWLVVTSVGQSDPKLTYRIRTADHPEFDGVLELEPNDVVAWPVSFEDAEIDEESKARTLSVAGYMHAADDVDRFELSVPVTDEEPADEDREATSVAEPPTQLGPDAGMPAIDQLAEYREKQRPEVPVRAELEWADTSSSFGLIWESEGSEPVEFRARSGEQQVVACGLDLDSGSGSGTFEVRAERLSAAPSIGKPQYELRMIESSASDDWEAEPNNDRGTADVLETGRRGAFTTVGDADIYVFAVEPADDPMGVQSVTLSAKAERVDLVLQVFDDQGGVIANADNGPIGATEQIAVDLPPGIYFAELRWKAGTICGPYEVLLDMP